MPTDRMRNGDFGEALTGRVLATDPLGRPIMENAIYDPRTTRVVSGQVVSDPFPNNVIPRELLDPVALKIQDYIPRATRAGMINNWDQSFPADTIKSISTIKLDHNFTATASCRATTPGTGGRITTDPTACRFPSRKCGGSRPPPTRCA